MPDLNFLPVGSILSGDTGAWIALFVTIAVLLTIDLWLMARGAEKHEETGEAMSVREAVVASIAWIVVAFVFAGAIFLLGTREQGETFLTGYVVERSLSLDNVFVFLVVFNAFAILEKNRARLLTYGILLALALRFVFITVGATALEAAGWLIVPFALILGWTGWKLWKERGHSGGEEKLVENVRKRLRVGTEEHGNHLTARENGKRVLTAAGATLAVIGIVDIIFAVDSVPAILGITTDIYIVFAANAFALLGLRPLFFLVADLVARLYYLKAALSILLLFIAAKMLYGYFIHHVEATVSLAGVVIILGTGVIASLVRTKRRGPEVIHVPGAAEEPAPGAATPEPKDETPVS
jgi:tellurite resistance protein TerC